MGAREILVVEDNVAMRKLARYALEQRGHVVHLAATGAEARALMRQHRPRLVLLDLVLPDCSGFDLVVELRELTEPETTFIAFTGYIIEFDESRLAAVGFDDLIGKPIEPERLADVVDEHFPEAPGESELFGAGKIALVADDDPFQRKLLRLALVRYGFEVHLVEDGRTALEWLDAHRADIVLADVMMPRMDGFELALSIRRRRGCEALPIVLVTSSYVDTADVELARRSGAHTLVMRTPGLEAVIERARLALGAPMNPVVPGELQGFQRDHSRRLVRQLERQVYLNNGLAQRCSSLAAELAILSKISETVLEERSIHAALEEALADCLDAADVAHGAMLIRTFDDRIQVHSIGPSTPWAPLDLEGFFGHRDVLVEAMERSAPTRIPSVEVPAEASAEILRRGDATSILIVPLRYLDRPLGALLMATRREGRRHADWRPFGQAIANQVSQVLALGTAVAETNQAERIARERTAFLDALLEQVPDFVMYVDRRGVIQYASRGTYGGREVKVGAPVSTVGTPRTGAADETWRRAVLNSGETFEWEEEQLDADGTRRTYSCRMTAFSRDAVDGVIVIARDATQQKADDAQLIASERMASVGLLAAGVAHEVNNPLAAVMANLEMLWVDVQDMAGKIAVPPEVIESVAEAREATERMRVITRDLRMFSRGGDEAVVAVDVNRVLESTLRMCRNELRYRAQVVRELDDVPRVRANDGRLGQVFLNLLINAAHAIDEGNAANNRIVVSSQRVGDERVMVRISDTGAGMPEDVKAKIFENFFTTKPAGIGTGLGLPICKKIVEGFGGTLEFDSEVGTGTDFRVILPVAKGLETRSDAPPPIERAPVRRGRILVIEDDPMVAAAVRRVLKPQHDVTVTGDVEIALARFEAGERYDLVLCDLMMPRMSGMEFHRKLQALDPAQADRIAFLTSGSFTTWAREFLARVPNLRIDKPFDVHVLRGLVNNLVDTAAAE